VVHGWTDETAHLEYAKRKSNPRKEKKIGWLGASSHTTRMSALMNERAHFQRATRMSALRMSALILSALILEHVKQVTDTEPIICSNVKKKRLIQNLPADLVTVRPHVIIRHGNMPSCH